LDRRRRIFVSREVELPARVCGVGGGYHMTVVRKRNIVFTRETIKFCPRGSPLFLYYIIDPIPARSRSVAATFPNSAFTIARPPFPFFGTPSVVPVAELNC